VEQTGGAEAGADQQRPEQISIGCQSRGTEQTAEQTAEQRAIGRSRQPDGRRRGRSRAGRADKRTEQRRTGGSADGGGRAEPGRLSPDSQVRRPFSSPSPLFSPPLSPHAAAMGAAHAGVWPRVPPPPRAKLPPCARFFPLGPTCARAASSDAMADALACLATPYVRRSWRGRRHDLDLALTPRRRRENHGPYLNKWCIFCRLTFRISCG
jgi:hypothetical protein